MPPVWAIIVASATMVAIVLMAVDNCDAGGHATSRFHRRPLGDRPTPQKQNKTRQNEVQYNGCIYFVTRLATVLYGLLIEAENINNTHAMFLKFITT